jgi:transposase
MAAGTRYPVVLTPEQVEFLEDLCRSRRCAVREQRNARILLMRHEQDPVRTVAAVLGCSTATIASVCRKFSLGGWATCRREAAHGRHSQYTPRDREEACGWVQTSPQSLDLPLTRWSLAGVQACWRLHRASPPPARSTFDDWFKAARLPWWQIHSACPPRDPAFAPKGSTVCGAYCEAPPQWGEFCYDQKPQIQALSRDVPNSFCAPGRPGYQEHDYHRHGVVEIHTFYEVRTGLCQWAARNNHRQETIAELLLEWLYPRPERQFLLIMDNLAANHAPAVQAALNQLNKLVLVLRIPTHSSWLNQVERVFADLQYQLLDHASAMSVADLTQQIANWFDWRNRTAQPYHWTLGSDSVMFATGY